MTEKLFSQLLKEKRAKMDLTQGEMAEKMGMKLRMYQLYERGDYDNTPTDSEKRRKHLRLLAHLDMQQSSKPDLEKENARLHEIIAAKDKLIDAQQKALMMAERLINSFTKKVAVGVNPEKRKN